jgi:quercetin dioxygenase-like cupin family protein
MKKMMNWVMIVTLICGSAALMNACKKSSTPDCSQQATEQTEQAEAEDSVKQVVSTELIRTSQSWDGVELPDYFEGRPELVAVKYVFPAGKKLGWHHHVAMNYGVLVQGELTIIGQDGKTKVVHEGEPVVEMVGTIHHGENRGTKDCILYMFYLSQKDLPLAVQHEDIPLE